MPHRIHKFINTLHDYVIINMGGACGAYGVGERGVQGSGGET